MKRTLISACSFVFGCLTSGALANDVKPFLADPADPVSVSTVSAPLGFDAQFSRFASERGIALSPTWKAMHETNVRVVFLGGPEDSVYLGGVELSAFNGISTLTDRSITSRLDGVVTVGEKKFDVMFYFVYVDRFDYAIDQLACSIADAVTNHLLGSFTVITAWQPSAACREAI